MNETRDSYESPRRSRDSARSVSRARDSVSALFLTDFDQFGNQLKRLERLERPKAKRIKDPLFYLHRRRDAARPARAFKVETLRN